MGAILGRKRFVPDNLRSIILSLVSAIINRKFVILRELLLTYLIVVGAQEKDSRSVNIRNRDDQSQQSKAEPMPIDEAIAKLTALRDEKRIENKL